MSIRANLVKAYQAKFSNELNDWANAPHSFMDELDEAGIEYFEQQDDFGSTITLEINPASVLKADLDSIENAEFKQDVETLQAFARKDFTAEIEAVKNLELATLTEQDLADLKELAIKQLEAHEYHKNGYIRVEWF